METVRTAIEAVLLLNIQCF